MKLNGIFALSVLQHFLKKLYEKLFRKKNIYSKKSSGSITHFA